MLDAKHSVVVGVIYHSEDFASNFGQVVDSEATARLRSNHTLSLPRIRRIRAQKRDMPHDFFTFIVRGSRLARDLETRQGLAGWSSGL
jgi:hypothetical protein